MGTSAEHTPHTGGSAWGWVPPVAVLALAIFMLGTFLGAHIARVRAQAPDVNRDAGAAAGRTIRCIDADQRLGAVWQTDRFPVQFHLVNEDPEQAFQFEKLEGGCLCTQISPRSLKLGPGEKAVVEASINLQEGLSRRVLPRDFFETVVAVAKDKWGQDIVLRMAARATVKASYTVEPSALAFGIVHSGETPEKSVQVECLAPDRARSLEVVSAPGWLQTAVEALPGPPGAFVLKCRPKQDAPCGLMRDRVQVRALLDKGPFVTWSVPLTGSVVEDISALPSAVLFAALPVGSERKQSITLQSYHGEAFVVNGVDASGTGLTVTADGAAQDAVHRFILSIRPASEGLYSELVTFRLRTARSSGSLLQVRVSGWVLPAEGAG